MQLPELDLDSPEDRATLLLGTAGVLGGGVLGYHLVSSLAQGDLFGVDEPRTVDRGTGAGVADWVVGALGFVLFGTLLKKTVDEYGLESVVAVASAVTILGVGAKLIRG